MFDNRQLVTLILLAVITTGILFNKPTRVAFKRVLKSLLHYKLSSLLLLYASWLALAHWVAQKFHLWNTSLLGESIFWISLAGISLIFRTLSTKNDEGLFRSEALDTVKISAFFIFFLNLKPFGIVGELALQVTLGLLAVLRSAADTKEEHRIVRRTLDILLTLAVVLIAIHTIIWLSQDWRQVDWIHETRKLLLPIFLTISAIPFLYASSLLMRYEEMLVRMRTRAKNRRPTRRAKLGMILKLRGRRTDIHDFSKSIHRADNARTVRDGIAAVKDFQADQRKRDTEDQERRDHLEAYSGVDGDNEDGRRLDQREFEESKKALLWLATCQMGWHRNRGNTYRPELLQVLSDSDIFQRHGLPGDHGIVMHVCENGQAWYAYRETISGWVLGVGASEAPPDQWYYDGPHAPSSFPSPGNGWGESPHLHTINWEEVRKS